MVRTRPRLIGILLFSALIASFVATGQAHAGGGGGSSVTVVASGLDHPKGLAFAADGSLYVAESGHSNGTCPPPSQTQSVTSRGHTGAVARIAPDGTLTRVATGLSSICGMGDYLGPSGVLASTTGLYILQSECTGDLLTSANASCAMSQPLLRLSADGTMQPVAQFISGGNGDTPNMPDENPYAIAQGPDGAVYVSDGANNAIWRFRPTATGVQRISQPLVQFPHDPTLTGLTLDKSGAVYVAIFGKAPWQAPAG